MTQMTLQELRHLRSERFDADVLRHAMQLYEEWAATQLQHPPEWCELSGARRIEWYDRAMTQVKRDTYYNAPHV